MTESFSEEEMTEVRVDSADADEQEDSAGEESGSDFTDGESEGEDPVAEQVVRNALSVLRRRSDSELAVLEQGPDGDGLRQLVIDAVDDVARHHGIDLDTPRVHTLRITAMSEVRTVLRTLRTERDNAAKNAEARKQRNRPGGSTKANFDAWKELVGAARDVATGAVLTTGGYYMNQAFEERGDFEIPGSGDNTQDHATRDWARLTAISVGTTALAAGIDKMITGLTGLIVTWTGPRRIALDDMSIEDATAEQKPYVNVLAKITSAQDSLENEVRKEESKNTAFYENDAPGKEDVEAALKVVAEIQKLEARLAVLKRLRERYANLRDQIVLKYPGLKDLLEIA